MNNKMYLPLKSLDVNRVKVYEREVRAEMSDDIGGSDDIDNSDDIDSSEDIDNADDNGMVEIFREIVMINADNPSLCHRYEGFNKFTVETFPLPSKDEGWIDDAEKDAAEYKDRHRYNESMEAYMKRRRNDTLSWLRNACDPSTEIFVPLDQSMKNYLHPKEVYDVYKPDMNGGESFQVFVAKDHSHVRIYGMTEKMVLEDYSCYSSDELYERFLYEYYPQKIFIGKSDKNKMSEFSGGFGPKFDGNTILMYMHKVLERFYYILIEGNQISEFTTSEEIVKYISTVGNNSVPYPYAETKSFVIDFVRFTEDPIDNYPNRYEEGHVLDLNGTQGKRVRNQSVLFEEANMRWPISAEKRTGMVRLTAPTTVYIPSGTSA